MSLDIQNRVRGACLSCGECPAYLCVTGRVLCDYCGCPPARHQLQGLPGDDQGPADQQRQEGEQQEEDETDEG